MAFAMHRQTLFFHISWTTYIRKKMYDAAPFSGSSIRKKPVCNFKTLPAENMTHVKEDYRTTVK
jgi:hypothetical protein